MREKYSQVSKTVWDSIIHEQNNEGQRKCLILLHSVTNCEQHRQRGYLWTLWHNIWKLPCDYQLRKWVFRQPALYPQRLLIFQATPTTCFPPLRILWLMFSLWLIFPIDFHFHSPTGNQYQNVYDLSGLLLLWYAQLSNLHARLQELEEIFQHRKSSMVFRRGVCVEGENSQEDPVIL